MNYHFSLMGVCLVVAVLAGMNSAASIPEPIEDQHPIYQLSTFKNPQSRLVRGPDGRYHFSFSFPQQERTEERDESGKVSGSYSFVDPYGEEVVIRYDADHEGFRPESDSLPKAPQDTLEVAAAREEFLRQYEETAKFLEALNEEEDYSYEDSDESSSEEDDEESSEEDDDEEEEDEEEEEEEEEGGDGEEEEGANGNENVEEKEQEVGQEENKEEQNTDANAEEEAGGEEGGKQEGNKKSYFHFSSPTIYNGITRRRGSGGPVLPNFTEFSYSSK